MKIQQQLATRLYELLPHKKELEFGCEIVIKDTFKDPAGGRRIPFNRHIRLVNETVITKDDFLTQTKKHIIEIIGQPLRLADVLMAIEKIDKEIEQRMNEKYDIKDASSNCFYRFIQVYAKHHSYIGPDKKDFYNLSKDNILDQSDEFCEFVLELLN